VAQAVLPPSGPPRTTRRSNRKDIDRRRNREIAN
jgi:hypothetical protein